MGAGCFANRIKSPTKSTLPPPCGHQSGRQVGHAYMRAPSPCLCPQVAFARDRISFELVPPRYSLLRRLFFPCSCDVRAHLALFVFRYMHMVSTFIPRTFHLCELFGSVWRSFVPAPEPHKRSWSARVRPYPEAGSNGRAFERDQPSAAGHGIGAISGNGGGVGKRPPPPTACGHRGSCGSSDRADSTWRHRGLIVTY